MKNGNTYIQIQRSVADELNKIKLVDRESYNAVIVRLLEAWNKKV